MELRAWQKRALPILFEAYKGRRMGVVRAATGSGKSVVIALLASKLPLRSPGERIVITVPTQTLVRQLRGLFQKIGVRAGCFFGGGKDLSPPILVACHGSLEALWEAMQKKRLAVVSWIADECHRTEAPTLKAWASAWPKAWRLGFTATPHRASDLERLSLYNELLFEYTAEDALKDGVIVLPRIIPYMGQETQIDPACIDAIQHPILRGLPGLVSAWDIDDAEAFAEKLCEAKIAAAPIHSRQPLDLQAKLTEALRRGSLRCLVHVNLLTEGADLPWLRWLCLRRAAKNPVSSRNRFIQEVGRILRVHAGKREALLLDPSDLCNRLTLTYQALLGEEPPPSPPTAALKESEEADETDDSEADEDSFGSDGGVWDEPSERLLPEDLALRQPLRSMAVEVRLRGLVPHSDPALRRSAPPSPPQLAALRTALLAAEDAEQELPAHERAVIAFYAAEGVKEKLQTGDIDDLLAVLAALQQGWRPRG